MKKLLATISMIYAANVSAQTIVQDKANTGQAKRMVFQKWDDWSPNPQTGFLGIPKNLMGFLYWRVLHNSYYNGGDKRPYRNGGPFTQNYASLTLQEKDDQHIRDSMQKVMETNLATYVSMSGGTADVAWNIYFSQHFQELFDEIETRMITVTSRYPAAASKITSNQHYNEYIEYIELTQDRVNSIHNSFIDRGDRIVTYLQISKELQHRNEVMNYMINDYIRITKLPTLDAVKEARKNKVIYSSDDQIVKQILVKFNF